MSRENDYEEWNYRARREEEKYWELHNDVKKLERTKEEMLYEQKNIIAHIDELKMELRKLEEQQYERAKEFAKKVNTNEDALVAIKRKIEYAEIKLAQIREEQSILTQREQNIAELETKSNKKVEELNNYFNEKQKDLYQKEKSLYERERELNRQEFNLKSNEKKQDQKTKEQDQKTAELEKRENELRKREAEIKAREEALIAKESNLNLDEKNIGDREEKVTNKEKELMEREQRVKDAEKQLKEKNRIINEQVEIINKQSELISYDEKIITKLTNKINMLHELTSKAKQMFSDVSENINEVGNKAITLEAKLKNEEKKSVFSIIVQRIKLAFSKTPLLPISNDCKEIYDEGDKISKNASSVRKEMQKYDEKSNINEINDFLRTRQNKKRDIVIPEKNNTKELRETEIGVKNVDGFEIGD